MRDTNMRFNWDREQNEEILLFRKMKWMHPLTLVKEYSVDVLKQVFLKFYFKFDQRNRAFWKIILEISDEEINEIAKKSFRRPESIGNF